MKRKFLDAFLNHVPFDGWTKQAFIQAQEDLKLEWDQVEVLFPKGMAELAEYWSEISNEEMIKAYKKQDVSSLKIREKIALAVKLRILAYAPHKESAKHCISYLLLSANKDIALKNSFKTVSEIWYLIGDKSTDWNYYSKRGLLLMVYNSTLLYWIQDTSDDFKNSWDFLDRRIQDVMKIPQLKNKVFDLKNYIPNPKKFFHRFEENMKQ